jgi:hypothetical protein
MRAKIAGIAGKDPSQGKTHRDRERDQEAGRFNDIMAKTPWTQAETQARTSVMVGMIIIAETGRGIEMEVPGVVDAETTAEIDTATGTETGIEIGVMLCTEVTAETGTETGKMLAQIVKMTGAEGEKGTGIGIGMG